MPDYSVILKYYPIISKEKSVEQLAYAVEKVGEQLDDTFEFNELIGKVDFEDYGDFTSLVEKLSKVFAAQKDTSKQYLEKVVELTFLFQRARELSKEYYRDIHLAAKLPCGSVVAGFIALDNSKVMTLKGSCLPLNGTEVLNFE